MCTFQTMLHAPNISLPLSEIWEVFHYKLQSPASFPLLGNHSDIHFSLTEAEADSNKNELGSGSLQLKAM